MERHLSHELLGRCGIVHGFGLRTATPPSPIARPRQVHGARVVRAEECAAANPPEADAVVSDRGGVRVGVVTADCVPVLAASRDGAVVAAIHAGWRGLSQGVVEAGIRAVQAIAGRGVEVIAVIGPHVGASCYEVDAPVLDALGLRFGSSMDEAATSTRPGHAWLALEVLVRADLVAAGVAPGSIGGWPDACTACDRARFHSFRRDGEHSGRMQHFIEAVGLPSQLRLDTDKGAS
jgi:YfiH family protein